MGTVTLERKKTGIVVFRAKVRREGRQVTKRFPNRSLAKKWIARTEAQIVEGTFTPQLKKYTVGEAIDRYLAEILPHKRQGTQELHKAQLLWFAKRIGSMKLQYVDSALLVKLREELKAEEVKRPYVQRTFKRSNATINRYFNPLSNLLRIAAVDWKWLNTVPRLARLKESSGRTRFLSMAEAKQLLEELNRDKRRDFRLVCLISLFLGTRLTETCSLRVNDIDFENALIFFRETKNGQEKVLPIPPFLLGEITEYFNNRQLLSEYLFPASKDGKRPYIRDKVRRSFGRACEKLGLAGVTFHVLRHSLASWLSQGGANRRFISEILGHLDQRTSQRYEHLLTQHLRPLINNIELRLLTTENLNNRENRAEESNVTGQ